MDEDSEKLIKTISAPVEKLIGMLGNAAGVLYEPLHLTRMAKAEVKANYIRTKGDIQLGKLSDRAEYRTEFLQNRRQQ
ncbi:MAG: hypothetical protein ACPG4N_01505, partial [Gammaproteobacteria bacterium]